MENSTFSSPAGGSPPPPLTPPPVIAPPAAPPRKGRGWMIAAIILIVLLAFSLLGNFTQIAVRALGFSQGFQTVTARQVGPKLDEGIIEDNGSHNKIAVITAQLDRAADDDRVKAVILKIDSPGGEVMAADEIYKAIADFQTSNPAEHGQPGRKGKPVICSMGSLAASGGYYIAAPCRWIVANELTLTGSIGVIMHGWNYRGLMDKVGVAPMTYKSGKFKDMLSPDRSTNEIPAEEHALVQALIDETYGKFTNVVGIGR